MRFPYWLFIATSALAGCGSPGTTEKTPKAVPISSKEEVKLRLAHATEDGGDFTSAENMFQQIAQQAPNSVTPQVELAEFYRRHHSDQRALKSLNDALKLDPVNTNIERELANTYINLGEPEKALSLLDSAIAMNPKDPLLFNSKGVALDQIGSYSEAQNCYKTAYDLDSLGGTTYKINISMSYILSGSYDKAIALLKPMMSMPDAPPIIRQNLALAYGMKGDNETALKLGLQDLSTSEVEENIRFYRMLAKRHKNTSFAKSDVKSEPTAVSSVPASDISDLFPEKGNAVTNTVVTPIETPQATMIVPAQESKTMQTAASVKPVTVTNEAAAMPPLSPAVKSQPIMVSKEKNTASDMDSGPTASVAPDEAALPVPILKPDDY